MDDIVIAKIKTTIKTCTENIRSFLYRVLNHVHGIGHSDKNTLTGLLEQASNHTMVFQQNFEVNYYILLTFSPSTLDSAVTITNLFKDYEWYLNFVGLTFAFALDLDIDKDDHPVLRTLMLPLMESKEKLASCYNSLQKFLFVTHRSTTGTLTTQIETENQATQDNAPPTPSDTPRHPVAHPDTGHDFEHDPEPDSQDQNILATESNELPNMSPDSNAIQTETTTEASTELPNLLPDSNVIETKAPNSDMITVDLKTQGTQLNPNQKQNPMHKKTRTPRYKFKRIKKGGKVQKIQSPGVHKMKPKPSHRNKRNYWSKQLCYVNNVSHDRSSSALQNFYHMVTSNINGLHTVIYPQNRWLLK